MPMADELCEKLEYSNTLYSQLLTLSHDMDANLGQWNAKKICRQAVELRNLRKKICAVDQKIVMLERQGPMTDACKKACQEREDIIQEVLFLQKKSKAVVSRMMIMLNDDIAKGRTFRNAAGGYFKKSRPVGRTFERTI